MGRRTTVAAAAVLAGALLMVTGCDGVTKGSATTDPAEAAEALWDPCTQISDDVLRKVGVDPATRDNTISGVENVEGWKLCSWHNQASRWDYTLGVWSTVHTIEETKQDENNIDFTDISVAGRPGFQFRRADDKYNEKCYLSFPVGDRQAVEISVYKAYSSLELGDNREPCVIAISAGEVLVPVFPK